MRVRSVNVGQPRSVELTGHTILTSIWKAPVDGVRAVRKHNIEGDRQADLTVHGGPYKAVYAYAFEHYPYWREQLPGFDLLLGGFGENLTTEGLLEDRACIGDRYRIGSAILQISQPRMPCFKLNLRFDRSDMVKRFWASGRSGIYFSIVEEGELAEGDNIQLLYRDPRNVSVSDVVRLFKRESADAELYGRAMKVPLFGSWKREIRERWTEAQMSLI